MEALLQCAYRVVLLSRNKLELKYILSNTHDTLCMYNTCKADNQTKDLEISSMHAIVQKTCVLRIEHVL